MGEEHLCNAGIEGNFPGTEPEDSQHFGHRRGRKHKVSNGQHSKEEVHGLVEAPVRDDDKEEDRVAKHRSDVHQTEGDGDPDVGLLHARDARQDEGDRIEAAFIELKHGASVLSVSLTLLCARKRRDK